MSVDKEKHHDEYQYLKLVKEIIDTGECRQIKWKAGANNFTNFAIEKFILFNFR